jgi:hypothetical protein
MTVTDAIYSQKPRQECYVTVIGPHVSAIAAAAIRADVAHACDHGCRAIPESARDQGPIISPPRTSSVRSPRGHVRYPPGYRVVSGAW